jgi:zinc/manganese transport system permease protein
VTTRPLAAVALSVAVALGTVWGAIALSFESNLPIGFFVGAFGAVTYGTARVLQALRDRHVRTAKG